MGRKLTRDQLNDKAAELGVESPEKLPNKAAVLDAIDRAEHGGAIPDLFGAGCRVLSVRGPFGSRTTIDVPTELAAYLFQKPLSDCASASAIDAVEQDLAAIRERDERVADSGIAAAAVRMAYELEDPYNSATAKAACSTALQRHMDRLLELSPPSEGEESIVERLQRQRAERQSES